jgi:thioredoxin-like negative regulator of GroEL
MGEGGLKIVHITVDGNEIDVNNIEKMTKINKAETITDANELLKILVSQTPMFIEVYASWCGHCKTLAVEWKKMTKILKEKHADKNLAIVSVEEKSYKDKIQENLKMNVNGFPTIYAFIDGKFVPYQGDRTSKAMLSYIESKMLNVKTGGARRNTIKRNTIKRNTIRRIRRKSIRRKSIRRKSIKRKNY